MLQLAVYIHLPHKQNIKGYVIMPTPHKDVLV